MVLSRSFNRLVSRRSMIAGAIGATASAVAVAVPARCSGRNYPGTTVHGLHVSGMTANETETMLRWAFTPLEDHAVTFTFGDHVWHANLNDLGMIVDYESMVNQASGHGRDGSVIDRYTALVDQAEPRNVPLAIIRDNQKLVAWLANIGDQIHADAHNARLVRRGSEIEILPDTTGRRLDLDRAREDTIASVHTGHPGTVTLQTLPIPPDVTAADLERAREDALQLVGEPLFFTHGDETLDIDTEELTGALLIDREGRASLDLGKLEERMQEIARAVRVEPQNVKLGWDGGLYLVADDVDGSGLDLDALRSLILERARSDERIAPLPMEALRAQARADNMHELGLDGHLAYGSSSFAGSSETRAANVIVSANNISYKLVPPGGLFSFNELLGPITLENGYVEGKIILGNWTASDIGGGVCQVSTTVFRAALHAGFRFTEWHAHSWRLGFYETDGSPPGMDAAIYQPNTPDEYEKDLIFENPLDSWLLLQMVIDGDVAYAHLYGRDNGWNVEVFEPRVSEPKAPGDPVVRENAGLTRGERIKVQNAQPGYTVYLRRKVTDADGNVVSDGDFVSDYRAQPEAWEVGPDTSLVPGTPQG